MSPMRNREGAFVGPHRVFGPEGFAPGLAMSRSLGDLLAHSLGVCPLPVCSQRRLTAQDQFVVRAWLLSRATVFTILPRPCRARHC